MTQKQTAYLTGFLFSLCLTVAAFELVENHVLSGSMLLYAILGLALLQFCLQLIYFLHLANEPSPHWNLQIFVFAFLTILIIIGASLWIMNNLKYRHESVQDETNYIIQSEGILP